ncbi:MAG: hypothetical protein ABWZ74_06785 [Hyphomicrobiaceae bacterium]
MADADTYDDELDPQQPQREPKSSRAWLAAITEAESVYRNWQTRCDAIDKQYADLNRMASDTRDREFQLFWANIQVMGPSIYARPPVPVVTPRFKDRRPLYRVSSELLERATIVSFDLADIDYVMRLVRDDLTIRGRGVPWVRYESDDGDKICIDHKFRRDFVHEPARNWAEVSWVAGASYLSKKEMRKRFSKTSGKEYQNAAYQIIKEDQSDAGADNRKRAKVWECWDRVNKRVAWVAEGCDNVLDEDEPHLKLQGFFPCPRPAYATLQPGTLLPVPDFVFYKDQLETINLATARIHALVDALQVRGFYPAGVGEIGDAINAALARIDNREVLIGVSNWAMLGQGNPNDMIVWLPIDQIANVITALVELRRVMIDDVYQIMGLSDIMRGETDAKETLGAQELKSQYGSVRIRDKIHELVRVARDVVMIAAEIMAEEFPIKALVEMSQLEIPTDAEIAKQIKALQEQAAAQLQGMVKQALSNPEMAAQAQQDPQAAEQALDQAKQQIAQELGPRVEELEETPTQEDVQKFLRDNKLRPFVLDIETDSTIQPNEQAEKQRRTEFMQAFMSSAGALGQMVAADPNAGELAGEMLKFVLAPFRAGRAMEGAIDEYVEAMKNRASQPQPGADLAEKQGQLIDAEIAKNGALAEKASAEAQRAGADAQTKAQELQVRMQEIAAQAQQAQQQAAAEAQKAQLDAATAMKGMEKTDADIQKIFAEINKMGADIIAVHAKANRDNVEAGLAEQNADLEVIKTIDQVQTGEANREQSSIEALTNGK